MRVFILALVVLGSAGFAKASEETILTCNSDIGNVYSFKLTKETKPNPKVKAPIEIFHKIVEIEGSKIITSTATLSERQAQTFSVSVPMNGYSEKVTLQLFAAEGYATLKISGSGVNEVATVICR